LLENITDMTVAREGLSHLVAHLRGDRSDELSSASIFSDRENHHPASLFNTLL
jgi:hypothetical protein